MRSQDVFRRNLKDLMAEHGLKVKDLADMVGLSPSYLSLILSGERQNLSDYHKDAIALALGTSVASLYTPQSEAGLGMGQSSPRTSSAEPGAAQQRGRDIGAFEGFLRVLNVKDDLLLSAFYKELNTLSDDEVQRFGQAICGAMVSWQESIARRQAILGNEAGGPPSEGGPFSGASERALPDLRLTSEQRRFLGLVACLSTVFGDVPLAMVEIATSWPSVRVHQMLDPAVSAGALFTVPGDEGHLVLRISNILDISAARSWLAPAFKAECLGRLGRSIAQALEYLLDGIKSGQGAAGIGEVLPFKARSDQVAEIFLEARDYASARIWYERAAEEAYGQDAWRVAKQYLMVVSSLVGILRTHPEERVRAQQMLATACLSLGEIDEALIYQERNIAFWERAGRKTDLTMGLLRASTMLSRKRDWVKAKDYLERALKVSSGDLVAEARARVGLATIMASTGSLTAAREELERTLDIGGKLNATGIMVQSLLGLGRIFMAREDPRRALPCLNRAFSLAERKESVSETWVKVELGRLWFQDGNVEKAGVEFAGAVERARATRNPEQEQLAAAHLARCLALSEDHLALEEALDMAASAERFFARTGDKPGLVVALVALAESSAALGDVTRTVGYFQDASREARESEDPVLEAFACEAFGRHLETYGDDTAAVMFQRARWAKARVR